jgi:hypothetical protein
VLTKYTINTVIMTIEGSELVNRFTTTNYYMTADFHTTNHSRLRLLNLVPLVFIW